MKLLLILIVLLFNTGGAPVPRAQAKFCGNVVISAKFFKSYEKQIRREGCSEVRTVPLENDFILIYGIKEVIGE